MALSKANVRMTLTHTECIPATLSFLPAFMAISRLHLSQDPKRLALKEAAKFEQRRVEGVVSPSEMD
jgi:predicted Ser/Thr protein kinase